MAFSGGLRVPAGLTSGGYPACRFMQVLLLLRPWRTRFQRVRALPDMPATVLQHRETQAIHGGWGEVIPDGLLRGAEGTSGFSSGASPGLVHGPVRGALASCWT